MIQKPSDYLFWISLGSNVMDQRSGDGRFIARIKNLAIGCWKVFFQISRCWIWRLHLLWTRSSRIPNSRRSVTRNKKPRASVFYEEDRSLSWSTTTFEWLALMIQYWTMLIYSLLLFMTIIFRNSTQDGMRFYYVKRFRPMVSWKVCTKLRIRESAQLKTVWELYDMEIHQTKAGPDYHRLKTMVTRSIEQKLRSRNFDARHGRLETGAAVKNRKGLSGVERGRGVCYQWKEEANVQGETNAVSGMRVTIMHKNRHRKPPHHLSPLCHEVEVCRGKEVSQANATLVWFFDNRADIVWKVLARVCLVSIGILPRVNFTKQKRVAKPETSVCSRIIKLMNNQTRSQRKASIPTKEEQATTKMLSLLWKVYHNWVAPRKTRSHWIVKQADSTGEPDAKSPGTDSKNTVHSVYATSCKYPGNKRTIAWKDTSQKSTSAKNLRYEIWGSIPSRDWKTRAMCPKQGLESCQKHFQAQRERQDCILLACEKVCTSCCVNQRGEEREFVVDSGASKHTVSKKDLNSVELETIEDIEESYDGDDGQRRGVNQRRRHGVCQGIGPIRDGYASWRHTCSSFTRETLRGSWEDLPLDQRSKTTSHQKWQVYQTMYHPLSLVYRRVPPHHPHLLLHHRIL